MRKNNKMYSFRLDSYIVEQFYEKYPKTASDFIVSCMRQALHSNSFVHNCCYATYDDESKCFKEV